MYKDSVVAAIFCEKVGQVKTSIVPINTAR